MKAVGVVKKGELYRAHIARFGRRFWIGTYDTPLAAAEARKEWETRNG